MLSHESFFPAKSFASQQIEGPSDPLFPLRGWKVLSPGPWPGIGASLGALAGSQSLGVSPYQEGKSGRFLQRPPHQETELQEGLVGDSKDRGPGAEEGEKGTGMFPVGSLWVRTVGHLPLQYHLKGGREALCELAFPLQLLFPRGSPSHSEGEARRGPDKGTPGSAKAPGDSGAGPPPAGRSWKQG